ncbi:marine proteobacterial sortase target protein [Vibrio phage vB_VmeM-32]|nr:marine proteobacterial sortase target protein [Vibrio phage vB_VmeM-32]
MSVTQLQFKQATTKPVSTNHVLVVDVSGSMYGSLPSLRNHIKNNLATMVKEEDTFSLIYFSGQGQAGVILQNEKIDNAADLSRINGQIDRFLKPIGLTGFVEPLQLAVDVAKSITNNNVNSLIFMTDGYDNCNNTESILSETRKARDVFQSVTILEYGYYCNRPLLEKMAAELDAQHDFAERVDGLNETLSNRLSQTNSKSIVLDVDPNAMCAVWKHDTTFNVVSVHESKITVPEHVTDVFVVDSNVLSDIENVTNVNHLYMLLYVGVYLKNDDFVWSVLKALGDVRLIKSFANCFTKQQRSDFASLVKSCLSSESMRGVDGYDYNMIPNDDAFTVVDLLQHLITTNAKLDTTSEHFGYNRIGLARKQKEDSTIDDLAETMASAQTKEERLEIAKQMAEHREWTPKFKQSEFLFSFNNIVMNSSRPNISLNCVIAGTIDIPIDIAQQYGLPESIDSKIYRNYTVVKDGIINMEKLPVLCDTDLIMFLQQNDVEFIAEGSSAAGHHIVIDLKSIPLINRNSTRNLSGKEYLTKQVQLEILKAEQKVLKHYRDVNVGKVNAVGLADKYGKDAADFLSSLGIRDYGFSPKSESVESTDFYISKEMNTKIKSLSSLPSIAAVLKKLDSGKKLTLGESVINLALEKYGAEIGKLALRGTDVVKEYITNKTREVITEVRALEVEISKVTYAVVVGNAWFSDLDFDNPSMTVTNSGLDFNATIALEEKEIKI